MVYVDLVVTVMQALPDIGGVVALAGAAVVADRVGASVGCAGTAVDKDADVAGAALATSSATATSIPAKIKKRFMFCFLPMN